MANEARTTRPIGFFVAVAVAIVCLAAIGFVAVRALTASRGESEASDEGAFQTGRQQDIRQGAEGLHIRVMDRDDHTRLAAELESETVKPEQTPRYSVGRPRATIYMEDGRLVRITADAGTIVMPDRTKAPETGILKGNVLVRLYEEGTSSAEIAADRAEPVLTWSGSSLTFDSTLGEVSTNEAFVLTSSQLEFRASDARLSINQTLERLERFSVRQGGTVVYFEQPATQPEAEQQPAPTEVAAQPKPAPGAGAEPAPGGQPAPAPQEPIVTLYLAAMTGDVHLERAGQSIDSDRLDLFARTIDNRLPPGAIASIEVEEPPQPAETETGADGVGEPSRTEPEPADQAPAAAETTPPQPSDAAPAEPVPGDPLPAETPPPSGDTTLTWTGPLEVRPLSSEPPELADNHVVARFTSAESGVVRFADNLANRASGNAALVEYRMTSRELILGGPAQRNVSIKSADQGEIRMSRMELDLSTGEAIVPGPYAAIGADGISRADCGERARLLFMMKEGRITGELAEVELVGNARATDGEGWIEAGTLHAYFDGELDGDSRLRRLTAQTSVQVSDGRGSQGAWESLDAAFEDDGQTPTSVEAWASLPPQPGSEEIGAASPETAQPPAEAASGNFRDNTSRIDAGHIFAQLRRAESGNVEVTKVWADGGVKLRRSTDQIEIEGEALFADADAQYLEVEREGEPAIISRGPTHISGERVRLNGDLRTAEAHGVGSFEHRSGEGDAASSVIASWTEGMAFDDVAGRLECLGEVEAVHEPDAFTRDTISAHALRVTLAPTTEAEETAPAEEGEDALALGPESDRAILAVYAAGPAFFGLGDGLATIESARYAAPPQEGSEPALEQAFRLSGVEVLADNTANTIDVPGRGRLFVADLRQPGEGDDDERGAALFDWRGSLHADRAAGTGEMLEAVEMSHTRTADGAKTILECDRLRVRFAPGESDANPVGGLRSAIAETNVYLRTDTRELTADLLQYDPDAGIARALAEGSRRLQILDRATGAPMSAAAVVWNLTTDRVDVVDPATITIPR